MAASGSGLDRSALETADRIVLGTAGFFAVWSIVPVWFTCCAGAGFNGFRGVMIVSWLLSIAAVAEIVLTRLMDTNLDLPAARGTVHLVTAGAAGAFALLGIVAKPSGLSLSWGAIVGMLAALAWIYGAYMMYSQPDELASSPPGATPPPPNGPVA